MKRDIKKTVRLSQLENQELSIMLNKHNLTFSDFARAKILGKQIKSKLSQDLIYQVNKIGNNLNQISKYANQNKSIDIQILQELVKIEKHLDKLQNVN
jgi:hypothetical protein